jgi:hypothetical protein
MALISWNDIFNSEAYDKTRLDFLRREVIGSLTEDDSAKALIKKLSKVEFAYDLGIFSAHCLGKTNDEIARASEEVLSSIDYRFFILDGRSSIPNIVLTNGKPRVVLGLACKNELKEGFIEAEYLGVVPYGYYIRPGCSLVDKHLDILDYKAGLRELVEREFKLQK